MRRLLCFAPVLLVGCFVHTHRETNAPGNVELAKPPPDLTERTRIRPTDPGEQGVVVQGSLTLHGVGWTHVGQDGHEVFLPFMLELAPWTFTREKSHTNQISNEALDGAVRPAIGLALRVFPKSGNDTRTELGPMWYEVQYVSLDKDKFGGVMIGGGVTTTYKHIGPQATLCMGAPLVIQVCGRGAWTTDEHTTIQAFVTYNGFAEWVWSR
ncbi:MAG: hypothetical protein ACXVEF_10945 [Polyangiales bacterium]